MKELETALIPMLVIGYGAICYLAGKGNLLNLIPLMLQEKLKELKEKLKEDE